jgi:TRAP transporter 4TM/12TM fusion protein
LSDGAALGPGVMPEPSRRDLGLPSTIAGAFVVLAVVLSVFQLFTAMRPVGLFYERGVHLALVEVLAFLLLPSPGRRGDGARRLAAWCIDTLLMACALGTALYLTVNLDAIVARAGFPSTLDVAAGVVATVTLLEASRRALGWPIALIGLLSVAYGYLGPFLPGVLRHGGYGTGRLMGQLYLGQEGIYGIPLGVAASFVFVFILFGALLEVTGAGQFFMDLAYALTGRQSGGPAKAAVVASAALGSVSGSAIANVVTSGAFTIPLMKRVGYRPEEAGGIEAAASTGGQVLPPIMGAGAFLMAEYTGLPYLEIVRAGLVPALLYLGTVFVFVHLVAIARGMQGLPAEELPKVGATLARRGGTTWSPSSCWWGLSSWTFQSLASGSSRVWRSRCWRWRGPCGTGPAPGAAPPRRMGPVSATRVRASLGGRRSHALRGRLRRRRAEHPPVSLACAVAGIIVGVVGLTGLGLKFSGLMLSFSQGSLPLALCSSSSRAWCSAWGSQ